VRGSATTDVPSPWHMSQACTVCGKSRTVLKINKALPTYLQKWLVNVFSRFSSYTAT